MSLIDLYVNDVLMSGDNGLEWGWSTRETLGGVGNAGIVVQDRNNDIVIEAHDDVKMIINGTGWVLWRGEVITPSLDLDDKFPWRRWKLDCSDYNNQLAQRLMGAFDGKTWIDASGLGVFVNIDEFASTLSTDKLTVQNWLDHYVRISGEALETDTYVNEYLSDLFPQDFDYSDVQQGLEKLASMVAENLQFWIDPDFFFHWQTIPAWQDLLSYLVPVDTDPGFSIASMMFPEAPPGDLAYSPYAIVDSVVDDVNETALSQLRISFDGNKMPEQVYVKGSTGYVYNAPPIGVLEETKTVVHDPVAGSDATYRLTLLESTKIWHVDGTGYVSVSYDLASAGGPYNVKWVSVPWNQARNKGGNYWKFLDGPYEGKLADDNTNSLNGYGGIRVEAVTGVSAEAVVGVGGSGWTNEAVQNRNKRQMYLEAEISSTVSKRNSIGGQAQYRGRYPTLRGSVKVRGVHGWRVGQIVQIRDARLPAQLNGIYYVIQEVAAQPVGPGSDVIEYTLGFGDGPESRYSAEKAAGDVAWPPPFIQLDIRVFDLSPGPNSTQTITAQLVNGSGEPWALPGKVVNWSFECYDSLGVLQSGQGSLSRTVSVTDKAGKARTRLTTGPGTALVYYVFAEVKAT